MQLIERFGRDRAEGAFTELVRRHVGLVYSTALRQVRSPQLAEEIAQSVFVDLAGQALRLTPKTILTAWLYEVTRRSSIDFVRRETRRQAREQIAYQLSTMKVVPADWSHIEPLLDEAMETLGKNDRTAVLLRYFENKSLREVGATLEMSENAAQKRISRAIGRLHDFFTKRGVKVGASGLAFIISANAIQAVPIGLVITISNTSLSGTTIAATAIATAAKTIAMTTLQKALVTLIVTVAVGTGIYEARQATSARNYVLVLQRREALLTEKIQESERDRDSARQRMTSLADEIAKIRSNNKAELSKLSTSAKEATTDPSLKTLVNQVALLQRKLEEMPEKKIPELQFATEKDWVNAAWGNDLSSEDGIRLDIEQNYPRSVITDRIVPENVHQLIGRICSLKKLPLS